MPELSQYISTAVYVIVIIFALIQLFLALRPGFIWGLLMPLMFLAFWLIMTAPEGPLVSLLGLNENAFGLYARISKLGMLLSLIIFTLCRMGKWLKYQNAPGRKRQPVREQNPAAENKKTKAG